MKNAALITVVVAALSSFASAADEAILATGTSQQFFVDTCDGARIVRGLADIAYAPAYSLAAAPAGSYVVIRKVEHPDTENASSSVLSTCSADASGDCEFGQEGSYVRLSHELRNAGGSLVGETLVADMSFAYEGGSSDAVLFDSRTDSLQLAVKADRAATLAYSTDWATNTASMRMSAIRLSGPGGEETATNSVFSAAADACGDFVLRGLDPGWYRLSCVFDDGSGSPLLEYLAGDIRWPGGLLLFIR